MYIFKYVNKKRYVFFQMQLVAEKRGGKRKGAGRKPQGKGPFTVTLTAANVRAAKKREKNFSGLLDGLLAKWLKRRSDATINPS